MTDLLVVTALRTEWLALRDQIPDARIVRCGMGPRRVEDWVADWDAGDVPGAVVVAGVAGGLAPDVEAGDVVVASEVRDGERSVLLPGAAPLVAALRAAGLTVHHAPILTTPKVVTGSRAELAAGGLAAVDMESMPLVRAALRRGVKPVAVVRVVVDTAHSPIGRLATVTAGARALAILRRVAPLVGAWAELATTPRRALLAGPRSFCAGVDRAIEIVERALRLYPHPVYVRRQIVHNQHVVDDLRARGAVFVEELDDLPDNLPAGTAVVLSAHGVAPAVRDDAERRGLTVVDATCPLVAKVHAEAKRYLARDDTVLFIGHDHHDETEGTLGEAPGQIQLVTTPQDAARVEVRDPAKVSYLMQTTLAMDEASEVVDALRTRFPLLADPPSDDICYATTNRQQAVRAVARDSDVVLVLGSENSSNSLRLVEVAEREGAPAYLIEDADSIRPEWISGRRTVGVTAGASAPPHLVDEVVATLRALGPVEVEERTVAREDVRFTVPKEVAI